MTEIIDLRYTVSWFGYVLPHIANAISSFLLFRTWRRRVGWFIFVFCMMSSAAMAHDWYPQECCHNKDCRPVTCDSITETSDGFLQGGLTYPRWKVRSTQDRKCHACSQNGRPICLFILPSS